MICDGTHMSDKKYPNHFHTGQMVSEKKRIFCFSSFGLFVNCYFFRVEARQEREEERGKNNKKKCFDQILCLSTGQCRHV
jgi:hypothetical protein